MEQCHLQGHAQEMLFQVHLLNLLSLSRLFSPFEWTCMVCHFAREVTKTFDWEVL